MGNLWSDLHGSKHLISRTFYKTPGTVTITAPPRSAFIRVSAVGAGGYQSGDYGGGAAFARAKAVAVPGNQFTVQVGDYHAGPPSADSVVTRVTGAVVILRAAGAPLGSTSPGLAASCVGDVKRSGSAANSQGGGASAGDDADANALGFGGTGVLGFLIGAARGGGGGRSIVIYESGSYVVAQNFPPGDGLVCAEFYDRDPGA